MEAEIYKFSDTADAQGPAYHLLLDECLALNLTQSDMDGYFADSAKDRDRNALAIHGSGTTLNRKGLCRIGLEHLKVVVFSRKKRAALWHYAEHIDIDYDFAQWLIPRLEARGFRGRETVAPTDKTAYYLGIIVFIILVGQILLDIGVFLSWEANLTVMFAAVGLIISLKLYLDWVLGNKRRMEYTRHPDLPEETRPHDPPAQ